MTTATSSAVFSHATDADARAWIAEFHTLISNSGLVQTADTGQINTATYTRPGGTNTVNEYSTWSLPDSSLYIKFQFGNGAATTIPRVEAQVGEGTNGAGTLTGQTSTNTVITTTQTIASTTTYYSSFACTTNDHFGVAWKVASGSAGLSNITWTVSKTVDNTGAATSTGYMVGYWTSAAAFGLASVQSVRRAATAATYTASTAFCLIPGFTASTQPPNSLDANGKIQVYTHWGTFPEPAPMLHTVTYRLYEIAHLNKFSVAVIGATPHTYIAVGPYCNSGNSASTSDTLWRLAFLWE